MTKFYLFILLLLFKKKKQDNNVESVDLQTNTRQNTSLKGRNFQN
jgi:hypothetical protein